MFGGGSSPSDVLLDSGGDIKPLIGCEEVGVVAGYEYGGGGPGYMFVGLTRAELVMFVTAAELYARSVSLLTGSNLS